MLWISQNVSNWRRRYRSSQCYSSSSCYCYYNATHPPPATVITTANSNNRKSTHREWYQRSDFSRRCLVRGQRILRSWQATSTRWDAAKGHTIYITTSTRYNYIIHGIPCADPGGVHQPGHPLDFRRIYFSVRISCRDTARWRSPVRVPEMRILLTGRLKALLPVLLFVPNRSDPPPPPPPSCFIIVVSIIKCKWILVVSAVFFISIGQRLSSGLKTSVRDNHSRL